MRPPPPISCESGLGPHGVGSRAVASSHPSPLRRRWPLSFSSRLGRLHELHVLFCVANRRPVVVKSPLCVLLFFLVHPSPRAHQHIASAIRVCRTHGLFVFRLSDLFAVRPGPCTYTSTWFSIRSLDAVRPHRTRCAPLVFFCLYCCVAVDDVRPATRAVLRIC